MSESKTWRDRFMAHEAEALDIEDEIDAWHEHDGAGDVFAWLGITREEYALYVRDLPAFERHMAQQQRPTDCPGSRNTI